MYVMDAYTKYASGALAGVAMGRTYLRLSSHCRQVVCTRL
jgi:hypothetical protein